MKIAILFSGGASAVPFLLNIKDCEIVGAISSSKEANGIEKLRKLGIQVEVRDIRDFYREYDKPIKDPETRKIWDDFLIKTLKEWQVDLVVCSGYMYLLTPEFVNAFNIVNVHPADLRITNSKGNRRYIGDDAVTDALKAGEKETRSTIHIMDEQTDHGPILVVSPPLPVDSGLLKIADIKQAASIHQEYMKYYCDGPAYRKALTLLAQGRLQIKNKKVYMNGEELKEGFVMTLSSA